MYDCENPDIIECPGSTCKNWGKCQFSKDAISENPDGYTDNMTDKENKKC